MQNLNSANLILFPPSTASGPPPSSEGGISRLHIKEGSPIKTYNKANIPLAKNLRKNMTPWERKLWYEFLSKYPLRFQRQKAIGDYIVDFYCAKAKLIIELDGGGHFNDESEKADSDRTAQLEKLGFSVIRIANNDIDRNFSGVCQFIDGTVKTLTKHYS